MRVLLLTTPLFIGMSIPALFQEKSANASNVSPEVFSSQVNLTLELIGVTTSGGKGPLMTDSAEQYAANQKLSISISIMIFNFSLTDSRSRDEITPACVHAAAVPRDSLAYCTISCCISSKIIN